MAEHNTTPLRENSVRLFGAAKTPGRKGEKVRPVNRAPIAGGVASQGSMEYVQAIDRGPLPRGAPVGPRRGPTAPGPP